MELVEEKKEEGERGSTPNDESVASLEHTQQRRV